MKLFKRKEPEMLETPNTKPQALTPPTPPIPKVTISNEELAEGLQDIYNAIVQMNENILTIVTNQVELNTKVLKK